MLLLAPPGFEGVQSMALVLWLQFKYYYYSALLLYSVFDDGSETPHQQSTSSSVAIDLKDGTTLPIITAFWIIQLINQ